MFFEVGAGFGGSWIRHEGVATETSASPGMQVVIGVRLSERLRLALDLTNWSAPFGQPDLHSHNLGARIELGRREGGYLGVAAGVSQYGGDLPYHDGAFTGILAGWRLPVGRYFSTSLDASARAQLYGDAIAINGLLSLTVRLTDTYRHSPQQESLAMGWNDDGHR
jgi:hypothetical protein